MIRTWRVRLRRWWMLVDPDNMIALASVGIAVHHAGLNTDDRKAVEELYLRKALRVLVATSVWDFSHSDLLRSLSPRPWRLALIYVSSLLPATVNTSPSSSCPNGCHQGRQIIPKWRDEGVLGSRYHADDGPGGKFASFDPVVKLEFSSI